jgi:serine protease
LLGIIPIVVFHSYATAGPPWGVPKEPGASLTTGEVLVKFKQGVRESSARGVIGRMGLSVLSTSRFSGVKRLRVPVGAEKMLARALAENPIVEYAEPNFIAWALFSPNDPIYPLQWHLDDECTGCTNPYGGSNGGGINLEPAWNISTGSGVTVAVVDTGVAYEDYTESLFGIFYRYFYQAPDLAATSFVPGYDFVYNDTHPNDDHSHGTHVAGTIAQSTNNSKGVAGVAFNASIMPVKVLDILGSGSYLNIADGIYFAADNGAQVINMSLGGPEPATTLEDALTIVAAAGNEGGGLNRPLYPAAYDPYVIAVAATRFDETPSYYSNTGSYVDIAAPGGDTTVDQNLDGYADGVLQQTFDPNTKDTSDFSYWFFQGTSMATPHVAGVAALLIANGTTGPDQVRAAIEATAEDRGAPGRDDEYGWGIVDPLAALGYSTASTHDVAVTALDAPQSVLKGDIVTVLVTVANQGSFAETCTVTLSVVIGSESRPLNPGETATVEFTWDTAGSSIGDNILTAEAEVNPEDTNLNNNSMTTTVTVMEPSHDVAVTAIDAPSSTTIGTPVSIDVTVTNEGTFSETTAVSLTDTTVGVPPVGSSSVTLSAGSTQVISFDWDTKDLLAGDHALLAEAAHVAGETDTADNSMGTTVTLTQAQGEIFEQGLTMKLGGKRGKWRAEAHVTVEDDSGKRVREAEVTGFWLLDLKDLNIWSTAYTSRKGVAKLRSGSVKAQSGNIFTFCVFTIAKEGYSYNPALNSVTCDIITVP